MAALFVPTKYSTATQTSQTQFFADLLLSKTHQTVASTPSFFAAPSLVINAAELLTPIEAISLGSSTQQILSRFSSDQNLHSLPVVKNGIPVGMIKRPSCVTLHEQFLDAESCAELPLCVPLLVDKNMPIEELSHFLAEADISQFTESFIITERGRYLGIATAQDVLRKLSKTQLEASRHAHPLTALPGSAPTNLHIERLIKSHANFTVCLANLHHFKPFNQTYGYHMGDEIIQLTGRILNWTCDPKLDFIGHLGGDRFILVMQSRNWKSRCENALDSYAQASALLFKEEHLAARGYHGKAQNSTTQFHPLTDLAINAVQVSAGKFSSCHEIYDAISDAQQATKPHSANHFFVARQ